MNLQVIRSVGYVHELNHDHEPSLTLLSNAVVLVLLLISLAVGLSRVSPDGVLIADQSQTARQRSIDTNAKLRERKTEPLAAPHKKTAALIVFGTLVGAGQKSAP